MSESEVAEESSRESGGASGDDVPKDARARLEKLREKIVALDEDLIRLVGERRNLVFEIGRLKEELGLPVLDPGREAQVVRRAAEISRKLGVDEELTRDVIWRIMASARETQEGDRSWGPPEYPPPEP
ncbi:MAG: chorismate mutase [Gemmatimonadota bacterium]